jgi:hypothetical protein
LPPARGALEGRARVPPCPKRTPPFRAGRRSACLHAVFMVLLFGRLYELRAEETAKGGARVVVVGPPCAGKTTFIKQFLKHAARR